MARRKAKKQVEEKTLINPIPCKLRELTEYNKVLPTWNPNKKRKGRYTSSFYGNVGKKRYCVISYIDGNFDNYYNEGYTDRQVLEGCIEFLNTPPPRKKYAKKTPKPLYGNLELIKFQRKEDSSHGVYFVVVLKTDQKKNRNFWGIGHESK